MARRWSLKALSEVVILKGRKASHGTQWANRYTLHTYIWKCILSSSNTKRIHEECIISGKKILYENIPATMFLNTKPLPIFCFSVAGESFFHFFVFLKKKKTIGIQSLGVNGIDESFFMCFFVTVEGPVSMQASWRMTQKGFSGRQGGGGGGVGQLATNSFRLEQGTPLGHPHWGQTLRWAVERDAVGEKWVESKATISAQNTTRGTLRLFRLQKQNYFQCDAGHMKRATQTLREKIMESRAPRWYENTKAMRVAFNAWPFTLSTLPPRAGLFPPLPPGPPRPPRPPRGPPRPRPGRPRSPKLISSWDVMSLAGLRKWCSPEASSALACDTQRQRRLDIEETSERASSPSF